MADSFEFEAWAIEQELEQDTVEMLKTNGFKSYRSLSKLNEGLCKKLFHKDMTPGQYVLLEAGLEMLRPTPATTIETTSAPTATTPAPTATTTTPTATTPAPAATTIPEPAQSTTHHEQTLHSLGLHTLLSGIPQPDISDTRKLSAGEVPTDPFCFGTGPFAAKKLRMIDNHITHAFAEDSVQKSSVKIGGVEVEVARPTKIANNKIHLAHYMEGALRILREMILDDALTPQQTLNHVNYLIQVSCLAQTNQWQRVLNYDTTYRREQFEHGFAWGSTRAFLLNAHFTAPAKPQHRQNDARGKHTPYNPNTGKTICLNWNGRWGCQRTNCNFEHVCKTCFNPSHTQAHHFKENAIGKN